MRLERWRYAIPLWLRGLFHRRDVERDLDDEIHDHIAQQTAANLAKGMRPDAARRAALVAFGGVERIKDGSRDVRRLSFIDGVAQLRYAARSLWRARTFTVATVVTIALAIGAGGAVFTLINAVLLRPLPYPDSDRLVGLWHSFPGIPGMSVVRQSPGTYSSYRQSAKSFESIGAYEELRVTVTGNGRALEPERLSAAWVTASIFSVLHACAEAGRVFTDADAQFGAPPVVVIGEGLWRTRLGAAPSVVGRMIRVDGVEREIVGVMPASFGFPEPDVRLWLPNSIKPGPYLGSFNFHAIGRLGPGVSIGVAQLELQDLLMRTPDAYPEQRPGVLTARVLAQARAVAVVHGMRDDVVGGYDQILWLVAGAAAVLVLVAFSNVASLSLARVEARRAELTVRSTLGASAVRIWWTLMAESAIVSGVGGILGVGIALTALRVLVHAGPSDLPRVNELHADWPLAVSALGLTMGFCLMSGLIGTWRVISVIATDLKRGARGGRRPATAGRASRRTRAAFVVVEVALSFVLLSASAVLGRSLLRLRAIQPGFDPANVFTVWTFLPPSDYGTAVATSQFYRGAIERIRRLPGVESAAVVSKLPLSGFPAMLLIWAEDFPRPEGALPPLALIASASEGYFDTMRIPIVAGRSFDSTNVSHGLNEVVVSRAFVLQYWNDSSGRRAIGRRLRPYQNGPWSTIVGVVGDVRDSALTGTPVSALYFPEDGPDTTNFGRTEREMAFVVRTRGPAPEVPASIGGELHAMDPALPLYRPAFMDDAVSKARSRLTFALLVLAAGATTTLALGVAGLYGVIAYMVGLRAREIGIRIALGLQPGQAARAILKQGEIIVAIGAGLGLLAFTAFASLLRHVAFDVSVADGASLATAAAIVVAVASVATWVPARRAARIDPTETLKSD